jgi:plastocyanin
MIRVYIGQVTLNSDLRLGHWGRIEIIGVLILAVCGACNTANAAASQAALAGRVVVTKVMTKKRVTLPAYDLRGATVNSPAPERTAGGNPAVDELSRVVIYLEAPGLKPAAPTQGTLTQKNRGFEPEIVVIPVGSTVSFPNQDPIFHNVFSLSKVKQFDLGYYPAGETRTVKFDRPGIVQVYCHIHPDMSAAILVLATPSWTRPGPDGAYSLSGIPPGEYDLVAWHRSAGFFRRHITISDGTTRADDFVIPVKESEPGAAPHPGNAQ